MRTLVACCFLLFGVTSCSVIAPVNCIDQNISENIYGILKKSGSNKSILLLPGASGYHEAYEKFAHEFNIDGWNTLILDYYENGKDLNGRSAFSYSEDQWQKWKENIVNAINYLKESRLATDSTLAIIGFSRGASLGLCVANEGEKAGAVIDFYGDLYVDKKDTSAIREVVKNLPPVLIIHGRKDNIVSVQEGELIYTAMDNESKQVEKHFLDNAEHAFVLNNEDNSLAATDESIKRSKQFLSKYFP